VKSNIRITEKIREHDFKLVLTLNNPGCIYLSTRSAKADFVVSEKLARTSHRVSSLILIFRPFFGYISWRLGMRSSYFTVAHSAARLLIAFSACRSAFRIKCQSQKRFFSLPFPLSLRFKSKGARVYTERGFSAEGRKGARKTANQICRLGKCCTGLGSYQRGIRFSSKVYFAVSSPTCRISFSRIHVANSHF